LACGFGILIGVGGENKRWFLFVFFPILLFTYMVFLLLQPRATLKFPLGEVSLEEKEEEELRRTLSVSGVVKSQLMNGLCTAQFSDEDLKLKYCYKVRLYFTKIVFACVVRLIARASSRTGP
jgi:hypothetical protein